MIPDERRTVLPRRLGLGSSIGLVIGITIGSGIFRSPAAVARHTPQPGLMLVMSAAERVRSKNRHRTVPRAIVIGTLGITLIYVMADLTYLYVLPLATIARSPLVAADAMAAIFGQAAWRWSRC
jgi:amino acid transporter